jgi:hypothetical protein
MWEFDSDVRAASSMRSASGCESCTTPVDRQAALKVVRATHLLVVHELRRYVRLPIVTEVELKIGKDRVRATSQEISAGGMSMQTSATMAKDE